MADREEIRGCDVLSGGFPCQPHSVAGRRLGAADERWLWPPFKAAIRHLRPRIVVVENVPGLLTTEFGDVLGGLAEIGFDAEWATLCASQFGAPHKRERLFIIGYTTSAGLQGCEPRPWIFGSQTETFPKHSNGDFESWRDMETLIRSLRECDGVSVTMVRNMVRAYGNAVMPQIAEWIGRRIVEACK